MHRELKSYSRFISILDECVRCTINFTVCVYFNTSAERVVAVVEVEAPVRARVCAFCNGK